MQIDETDLSHLLKVRKDMIGHSVSAICGEVVSFIGLAVSLSQIDSIYSRYFVGAVAACVLWRIFKMVANKYNDRSLAAEIKALDEVRHKHALIVIKDTFDPFPNKYLTYYDKTWGCPFLLNFKSTDTETLKRNVSAKLKVPDAEIALHFVGSETYRKYSTEAKTYKWYEHSLYHAEITNFPAISRQDSFAIEGMEFTWMTIEEMKRHPQIINVNMDVVHMIEKAGI